MGNLLIMQLGNHESLMPFLKNYLSFMACPLLNSPVKNPSMFMAASQQNPKSFSSGGKVETFPVNTAAGHRWRFSLGLMKQICLSQKTKNTTTPCPTWNAFLDEHHPSATATVNQHLLPARALHAKSMTRGLWLSAGPHCPGPHARPWCLEAWLRSPVKKDVVICLHPWGHSTGEPALHRQVMQLWYLTKSLVSEQSEPSSRCLISQHFKHFSYPDLSKISQEVRATSPLLCSPSGLSYYSLMSLSYFTWSLSTIFPLVQAGSHEWDCSQTLLWNFSSSVQAQPSSHQPSEALFYFHLHIMHLRKDGKSCIYQFGQTHQSLLAGSFPFSTSFTRLPSAGFGSFGDFTSEEQFL